MNYLLIKLIKINHWEINLCNFIIKVIKVFQENFLIFFIKLCKVKKCTQTFFNQKSSLISDHHQQRIEGKNWWWKFTYRHIEQKITTTAILFCVSGAGNTKVKFSLVHLFLFDLRPFMSSLILVFTLKTLKWHCLVELSYLPFSKLCLRFI